ncbi:MAG: LCP family protein [Clostridia bacterium]|nr:LCP family protein [Clostridia bacterium]
MNEEFGRKRRNKRGLTTKAKVIIAVVLVIYAVIMFGIGFIVFYKPSVSHEVPFNVPQTDAQGRTVEHEFRPKADTYNFLLLGRDKMATLTDVMMIINVDTAENSVSVMQIPRDTFIAGNYPTNKMNAVYSTLYYNMFRQTGDEKDAASFALNEFTKLIEQSLCINIHYSAIINLEGFKNIVDILGGVDVNVQFPLNYVDPEQGLYIDIPAGYQHLNGAQAEGFVRFRHDFATQDMGRQDNQKKFLFALFSKIKSTVKITEIPRLTQLANEIYDNLLTDLPATDVVFFAKCLLGVDSDNIRMFTIPGSLPGGDFYIINKAGAIHAVNQYFNAYSQEITDYMFDPNQVFNDYSGAYDAPAEYAEFGKVYENGEEIYIMPG